MSHDEAMEDFPAIFSVEAIFPADVQRIRTLQDSDPTLKVIKSWVREGKIPPKLVLMLNGTLVRSYSS